MNEFVKVEELSKLGITPQDIKDAEIATFPAERAPRGGTWADIEAEDAAESAKAIEYRWSFDRYRPSVGKMAEGTRCYAPTEEAARAKVASWYTNPEDEGTTFVLVDKGEPCDWMPDESGKIKCLKCGKMVYTRISGICLDCHRLESAKTDANTGGYPGGRE